MEHRGWPTAAAMVTCAFALACVSAAPAPRPVRSTQHCGILNDRELRHPIEAETLKLYDSGGYVRLSMVVEVILDRKGYVTQPRVAWADPPGVFDRAVLESIGTWRFCPQLAWRLDGEPFEIPVNVAFEGEGPRYD